MIQLEMFSEAPSLSAEPKPDQVRERLEAIFSALQSADKLALSELRRLKVVVPQMARWLTEAERVSTIATFETLVVKQQSRQGEENVS